MSVKIAPSVLSADCDGMDGVFVPNLTFGIKMVADMHKRTRLPLDCHLMIVEPQKYVADFAAAGAEYITVHYEACKENLANVLKLIKEKGCKAGAVINPDTPVSVLEGVLPLCDMVVLMSVFPGFGGQKYIDSVTEKIAAVREMVTKSGLPVEIEVDGGITAENVAAVKAAGASVIVAGSAIFRAADRAQAVRELRER